MEQNGSESTERKDTEQKGQKEFEGKLDQYADKISNAVNEGVKRVEEAFERGKESLKARGGAEGEEGDKGLRGSRRTGAVLIVVGIVWLLYIAGFFQQWIFPVLVIILGIYFIFRNR